MMCTSLTEDFIEVQDKWLDGGSSESLQVISEESVEKKLKGLCVRKASGPYDPNIKVLKMFVKNFAIPLTNIFNESFQKYGNVITFAQFQITMLRCKGPETNFSYQRLVLIQESYAIEWINQDVGANINESQNGGLPGSSAVLALFNLLHKWYLAMETPGRLMRIIFLDFRKAYDLV